MITLQDVLIFHNRSIIKYGGINGVRDENGLKSAIERINTTFDGNELYPTPFEKAAAILESILKNHPFIDGNKRTALICCAVILDKNGFVLSANEDVLYDFIIEITTSRISFHQIVDFLTTQSIMS